MTDLQKGEVITFYSYKGGSGRSMALANIAWILASNGKRVLVIDWDLEAPGLHRYFAPFLIDKTIASSEGLIDFILNFVDEALGLSESEKAKDDWYLPYTDINSYVTSLSYAFKNPGRIDFIPAGRQDSSYAIRVNSFDWRKFYKPLGGGLFLEKVKERIRAEYDYILIDSRTGVSDASGICTVQMPNILVICFTLNNQSIEGAAGIANSVRKQRPKNPDPKNPDDGVKIFPIPMRVETGELDKLEDRKKYAWGKFARFLDHIKGNMKERFWGNTQVPYVPYYAFEEILSTFRDKPGDRRAVLDAMEQISRYITGGQVSQLVPPSEAERQKVLAEFSSISDLHRKEQSKLAEEIYSGFSPQEGLEARRLLTRMVRLTTPQEGGSDTCRRANLYDGNALMESVVEKLADAGLLVIAPSEGNGWRAVELADETLIHDWERLRGWIEEDREFLLWRQKLRLMMAEWERTNQDEGCLLLGASLAEAKQNLAARADDLTPKEREFINESEREEKELASVKDKAKAFTQYKLTRRWWYAAIAVLSLAIVTILIVRYFDVALSGISLIELIPIYPNIWEDKFSDTNDHKPDRAAWDYPPDQWEIVKPEGIRPGWALLVKGQEMGVLNNLRPYVFKDFILTFQVRIVKGTKAAWALRVQPDKRSAYIFELVRQDKSLFINGYVADSSGHRTAMDDGLNHEVRVDALDGDTYIITASVNGFGFDYSVKVIRDPDYTIQLDPKDIPTENEKFTVRRFTDRKTLYRYGNLGLLETDADSQMQIDDWVCEPSPDEPSNNQ